MPEPSCVRPCAPRRGGSARTGAAARPRALPTPVSPTSSSRRRPASSRRRTAMRALERELEGVREQVEDDLLPHLAIDVDRLGAAARSRRADRSPARSHRRAERCWRGRASARARSVGLVDACTRPASMREKSSSELTSFCSRSALRCASSSRSRLTGGGLRHRPSTCLDGPSISVSGVRNSWLTLEKKAVLARSSLGQRFGALALRLVGARVARWPWRSAPATSSKKLLYCASRTRLGAHPGHKDARELMGDVRPDGHHHRGVGGSRQGPGGTSGQRAGKASIT